MGPGRRPRTVDLSERGAKLQANFANIWLELGRNESVDACQEGNNLKQNGNVDVSC